VVVLRPGRRTEVVGRWLRQLLPAATLLVGAPGLPRDGALVLNPDEIESPMALAAALTKDHAPGPRG